MSVRFKGIRAGIKMRVGERWKSSELKEKAIIRYDCFYRYRI